MGSCRKCATDTGLFGGELCDACEARLQGPLATWVGQLNQFVSDGFLSAEEEAYLRSLQFQFGLSDVDVGPFMPRLMRMKMLSAAIAGPAPSINVPGLLFPGGEVGHYYFPFQWHVSLRRKEYQSTYSGASVRVAKGLTFRTGGSRGRWVTKLHDLQIDGAFVVTNRNLRILTSKIPAIIPLKKLQSFEYAQNGIALDIQGETREGFFAVDDGEFVAATLFGAKYRLENPEASAAPRSRRVGVAGHLRKGMSRDEVLAAVGHPDEVDERVTKKSTKHVLKYRDPEKPARFRLRVTLEGGLVVAWAGDG